MQQAAGCLIGDAPNLPTQAGHPCRKLQSILVKARIFFITLRINCKEKGVPQVFASEHGRSSQERHCKLSRHHRTRSPEDIYQLLIFFPFSDPAIRLNFTLFWILYHKINQFLFKGKSLSFRNDGSFVLCVLCVFAVKIKSEKNSQPRFLSQVTGGSGSSFTVRRKIYGLA